MPDFDVALVAELAKKSGLVWIAYAGATHPVWHEWVGDAVCVVANGHEQPLPDIDKQSTVTLLLRSKAHRHLVTEAEASVEVLTPTSDQWDVVTAALKTGRLNVVDRDGAIDRWAAESQIIRLIPTGTSLHTEAIPDTIGHSLPHLVQR